MPELLEKQHTTPCGIIHYWMNNAPDDQPALVFLPGLTADHRLFDKQLSAFSALYRVLVWDAPQHGASRPFRPDFSLADKARWLHEILQKEGYLSPVLIGQSMGGYVSQSFMELYPGEARGFISIDSAPLKRSYVTSAEIWLLKRCEPMYRMFPWKLLLSLGSSGVATTPYGQSLMHDMMVSFHPREYCALAGHGFKMLAEAMEADLPYAIDCPSLLICGEKDQAGSAKNYNKRWAKKEGLRLEWIKGAGHNANTDDPDRVNSLISEFIESL